MSPDQFRRIALTLPDAVEGSHQGHADFRVRKRIFATLGYPDDAWGMVTDAGTAIDGRRGRARDF